MQTDQYDIDGASPAQSDQNLLLLKDLSGFCSFGSQLASQCRSSLKIYSPNLNAEFYASEIFVDACSAFARSSRRSQVDILVCDASAIIENYHSLIGLQKRLSDKIKLRVLPKDFDPENIQKLDRPFMVGDDNKVLIQHSEADWQGFVNFNDRPVAKEFGQKFTYLWQHGEPVFALQRLGI